MGKFTLIAIGLVWAALLPWACAETNLESLKMHHPQLHHPRLYRLDTHIPNKKLGVQHPRMHVEWAGNPRVTDASTGRHPHAKVIINIPSRSLSLYEDDTLIKEYPVAVGAEDFHTPLGQFQVISKVTEPEWENPYQPQGKDWVPSGRNSPLGPRWIGFKMDDKGGEYGIHGTNTPGSIGQFVSHGCIRMNNADILDLYNRIEVGTPVQVAYALAVVSRNQDQLKLVVYPDHYKLGHVTPQQILNQVSANYPNAVIHAEHLQQALAQASGKPMIIGTVPPEVLPDAVATEPSSEAPAAEPAEQPTEQPAVVIERLDSPAPVVVTEVISAPEPKPVIATETAPVAEPKPTPSAAKPTMPVGAPAILSSQTFQVTTFEITFPD